MNKPQTTESKTLDTLSSDIYNETSELAPKRCGTCSECFYRECTCCLISNKLWNKMILFVLLTSATWLIVYLLTGKQAVPGGPWFSLITLTVCSHISGFLFQKIKLPGLLAMLLTGIAFKNIPVISIVGNSIDPSTCSQLRWVNSLSLAYWFIYFIKMWYLQNNIILCDSVSRWPQFGH